MLRSFSGLQILILCPYIFLAARPTSDGVANSRPCKVARHRTKMSKWWVARGEIPPPTARFSRRKVMMFCWYVLISAVTVTLLLKSANNCTSYTGFSILPDHCGDLPTSCPSSATRFWLGVTDRWTTELREALSSSTHSEPASRLLNPSSGSW